MPRQRGAPTLVVMEPKRECPVVESIPVLVFMARCPRCNVQRSQSRYTTADLDWLLGGDRPIDSHCATCGESWALSDNDRANLAKMLAVVRYTESKRSPGAPRGLRSRRKQH